MSDLVINVKQISNYPNLPASAGTETLLVQAQGLGGPYQSISARALVSTALNNAGPLGVGVTPPTDAEAQQVFAAALNLPATAQILWDAYATTGNSETSWSGTPPGSFGFSPPVGWNWATAPVTPGKPLSWFNLMVLTPAGQLRLPLGTISVARDPASPMEVATLNWVGNNTVASFNNRIGAVQLTQTDVYQALGYTDYIATQPWTINAINAGIGNLISTYPLVTTFNTRTGDILLTLSDITCVFFQPGQQPISPTPPTTSNDNSIATTQWVTTYITNELSGTGQTLATQPWVLANTVNSFNTRQGPVTLTAADVFDVGAAPLNSPAFSGIPNAPTAIPGTSTSQLATTAFVQAAVASSVAGVASFNTRTGAVTLTNADISAAGGLANPNVALTGAPTAPTATAGTSTTQIATTQFVTAAVNASVVSFNTRTGAVTLQLADVTGVGGAPVASPTFTGIPAAPTASPGTNTTQLATTGFVTAALTAAGGVSSFNSRTGAVVLTANDISAVGGLVNPSVNLTGTPTAPTAPVNTNTTQLATCAYVQAAVAAGVISFNTRTGAITLVAADITGAGGALLASPNLTGTPTAPTATAGTNNTQIATTQFVQAAISSGTAGVTSFNTRTGAVTLLLADITGAGGAPINNAALTGTPTAPTATAGTSSTQIATTAFVQAAMGVGAVTSFNGRTGAVTLATNDITAAGGAPAASPTLTGIPVAPTAAAGTSTTQLATTQFAQAAVAPALNDLGRNLCLNPIFTVAQRGTGPWTTAGALTADRWRQQMAGSDTQSTTIIALTDADRTAIGDETASNALQCVFTGSATGGSQSAFMQNMESLRRFGNKTVTVSFWVKATASLSMMVSLVQSFGTGGSPSANVVIASPVLSVTTTWTRLTTTLTLPSVAGKTFGTTPNTDFCSVYLIYSQSSGNTVPTQSGTIQFYGVQVEYGTVMTSLVHREPDAELAACQRFYQTGQFWLTGYGAAGVQFGYGVTLPVTVRGSISNATLTSNYTTSTNATSGTIAALGSNSVILYGNATATAATSIAGSFTVSADL